PNRRGRVAGRVAEAAVGTLEPFEVGEGAGRRRFPGGEEGLDCPRRGLRVRAAPGGQLEAAVAVAVAEQESERAPNRAAPDAGGGERFDHGGGVVRVDGPRRPTPAAAAALQGEQPAGRASRERLPGRPEGDHAPGGSVDEAADRAVRAFERAKPREQPVGTL